MKYQRLVSGYNGVPRIYILWKFYSVNTYLLIWKIDFQDGDHSGRPSWISIATILAIFALPHASYTKFQVNWPFGSGEEAKKKKKKKKKDFQDSSHGGHLGFQIEMILAIFGSMDLQATLMILRRSIRATCTFISVDRYLEISR